MVRRMLSGFFFSGLLLFFMAKGTVIKGGCGAKKFVWAAVRGENEIGRGCSMEIKDKGRRRGRRIVFLLLLPENVWVLYYRARLAGGFVVLAKDWGVSGVVSE